ncbi:MAG TPA: metallophosphoesterase [Candidatus Acidoferrales bacterium]|nr:metallophosphoesterase [Candidatus Acidoferrales bacterium]
MSATSWAAHTAQRARAWLVRAFFQNFFRLLVITVSLSQWGLLWWLDPRPIRSLSPAVRLGGPLLIYSFNRWLAIRTQRVRRSHRSLGGVPRAYFAFAFTCLFCMGFLLATGALWLGAKALLETMAVQARTTVAGLAIDSDVDTAFRWLADAGTAAVGLVFVYGYSIGQRRLRITHLRLPLRHCRESFDGLRIVQISDIHVGQNLGRDQLGRFVARVNALCPDLICITGDIADAPSADLDGFLPLLADLRAAHGVFAILGNHDHYAGAERVVAALRRLTPFTVLRDQRAVIAINGQPLHIIGLDDRGPDWARGATHAPYLDAALAEIPADEPVLLLCHRPDIFPHAAAAGVALTLSGHTHGGQLGIPWVNGRVRNLAEFITRFDRGLFARDGSYLYVNCGLGITGQRIRLCTPREITLIDVQPASAQALAA